MLGFCEKESVATMQTIRTAELREWERRPTGVPICLVSRVDLPKEDTFAAAIDASLSGLRVRTTLALVPRQEVSIVVVGQFTRTLHARVVWVRREESGESVLAGLKFLF